jgi:hypothetical protein
LGGQRGGPGNDAEACDPRGDDCAARKCTVHDYHGMETRGGTLFPIEQPAVRPLGRRAPVTHVWLAGAPV